MLFFLDIETTGLNPEKDLILEIACVPADDKGHSAPPGYCTTLAVDPSYAESLMDPYVKEMHTKNGLLKDLKDSMRVDPDTAEKELCELVQSFGADRNTLAGNSIHFDARFLRAQMPNLAKVFHYRMLDISSLGICAASAGVSVSVEDSDHRALRDCHRSRRLFREYRKRMGQLSIAELVQRSHASAKEKGWWDHNVPDRSAIPEKLALIHSEISQALEAYREGKSEGLSTELADALIRIFDLAGYYGLNLSRALDAAAKKDS